MIKKNIQSNFIYIVFEYFSESVYPYYIICMLTWGNKTQTVAVAECLYVIVIVYYLLLCEYSVCDVLVSDLIR